MSAYRPYPKTKPSGVEWLGDVPVGWEHLPGRRIFEQRRDSALPTDEQLSATQKYGVIPQALFMEREDQKVVLALSGIGSFKHVEIDNFVISLRSFQGGIEHSAYSGCVSPAYTVLRSKRSFSPRYNAHLLKCPQYIAALQAGTDGIREGKSISYEQFGQITIPIPPLPEQHQIAAFLDRECGKLDALQAKQERLIELLKEKRQALIGHAVTRGLDPTAKLKPSGIEWLGEVPEHWRVGKCGFYLTVLSGFAFPSTDFTQDESQTKLLRGINVGVSRIKWDDTVYWQRSENDGLGCYEMKVGDLVVGMDRPWISEGVRVAKISEEDLPSLLLQRVTSLKTNSLLSTDYLFRILSSEMFVAYFTPDTTGVSVPHISPDQICDFVIPIPPLAEQRSIVAHLDKKCGKIDQLKAKAERGIELLKERRSALISAAVTGKIDVRDT